LVVTCEHGGRDVPARYAYLFDGREDLLASHRGWDAGALALATEISRRLGAPLVSATTTRLLVDLNRSLGHRGLFSEVSRSLGRADREELLAQHYRPYRDRVLAEVTATAREAVALHLSVHSFTPVLRGIVRRADLGLLYDPARRPEERFCARWRRLLRARLAGSSVLRNSPYRGASDGLTTDLRKRFPPQRYLGIELEVNTRHLGPAGELDAAIGVAVIQTLAEAMR
jgi:predicted N-formylglutamate amidohydrolase